MRDSFFILLLLATITTLSSNASIAQETMDEAQWVVSCSQNSRLVYREKMSEIQAMKKQRDIILRYPGATCVFLAEQGQGTTVHDVANMPLGSSLEDADLNAALRAITGEQPLLISLPTPRNNQEQESKIDLPSVADPPRYATAPGWVRLSTYMTDNMENVLDDWERVVAVYPKAKNYTPTTRSTDDGYIMLSAGPMTAAESWDLCLMAQGIGMDCEPNTQEENKTFAIEYLRYWFPSAFVLKTENCTRKADTDPRLSSRACWKTIQGIQYPLPTDTTAEAIMNFDQPPLPRPRPVINGGETAVSIP